MKQIKTSNPSDLKRIADEFNNLSAYEQYITTKNNKEWFSDVLNRCFESAKEGRYSITVTATLHYQSPAKDHIKKYFTDMGYNVNIIDPRSENEHINDFDKCPYRWYCITISWK